MNKQYDVELLVERIQYEIANSTVELVGLGGMDSLKQMIEQNPQLKNLLTQALA